MIWNNSPRCFKLPPGGIPRSGTAAIAVIPFIHGLDNDLSDLIDVLGSPWAQLGKTLREAEEQLTAATDDTLLSAALKTYQLARDDWDAIEGDR